MNKKELLEAMASFPEDAIVCLQSFRPGWQEVTNIEYKPDPQGLDQIVLSGTKVWR